MTPPESDPDIRPAPARARRGAPGARRGFTLVEVLATMLLLGIVLPVAIRGVSMSMQWASHARHTAEAATLAETKLNELIATRTWTSSGVNGDFCEQYPAYKWTCQAASSDYGLTQVDVRVTWLERGQERFIDVSTLTYESGDLEVIQ